MPIDHETIGDNMSTPKYVGRKKKTQRGFGLMEFKDINGDQCSIQESSVATKNCLWLGCDHETVHPVTGERCGARMHLDVKLAKQIINTLQKWVDSGYL